MAHDAVTASGTVLVVASEDTATAWASRLVEEGVPALAVPSSSVARGPDVERAAAALCAAAGSADPRPVVIVTSRNAVRFLPAAVGAGCSAVVVGEATARAARAAGFAADAGMGPDSAVGFASVARRLLAASPAPRAAIWLRGDVATREGVDLLAAAGWAIQEFVTYVAVPRATFADDARGAPAAAAWVVGSPAAARALCAALGADAFPPGPGGPRVLVPGDTTAAALAVAGRVVPEIVPGLPAGLAARLRGAGPTSTTRP